MWTGRVDDDEVDELEGDVSPIRPNAGEAIDEEEEEEEFQGALEDVVPNGKIFDAVEELGVGAEEAPWVCLFLTQ